jgi:hypothetical protein
MAVNTNKQLWEMAEKQACLFFGTVATPGSGNGNIKSDSREVDGYSNKREGVRVEVKSTVKTDKFVLQWEWFAKIIEEAEDVSQIPCLYFYFGDHVGFAITPVYFLKEKPNPELVLKFENKDSLTVTKEQLLNSKYIMSKFVVHKFPASRRVFLWKITYDDGVKTYSSCLKDTL